MKAYRGKNGLMAGGAVVAGIAVFGCLGYLMFGVSGHHTAAPADGGKVVEKFALSPEPVDWSFNGLFGTMDRASAQRGLQVYKEVCSACHGLHRVSFRTLQGIGLSEGETKALAKEYTFTAINDEGETIERPGIPSDYFPSPFANEEAARAANGGAYPPDLSLMVKARPHGADYIHSLLNGYDEAAPADFPLNAGMHYNPYFEGRQIGMPPPLTSGGVSYQDNTEASVEQMSRDVVAFLQWTAEPEMEQRKRMGLAAIGFLIAFTGLFIAAKKRVWAKLKESDKLYDSQ